MFHRRQSSRARSDSEPPPHVPRCRIAGLLAAICLSLSAVAPAAEHSAAFNAALESITAGELQAHVDFLADDALEGRLPGTDGSRQAGEYLRDRLKETGLHPAGDDDSFFQPFEPDYRNILARLPGRDPALADQVIVVGAHYDHVGLGTAWTSRDGVGEIHNGADDNASGTATVLELAEAFAMLPEPPRRTLLFALWDAEELGFNGSRHFAAHPTVPLRQIVLVVNFDMVGRLREDALHVYGTRTTYGMRRLLSRNNLLPDLTLTFNWDLDENSDHWVFFSRDLPVLLLHTGVHDDYHTPRDDAELINEQGMGRVTRLLFGTVYDLAERAERPSFREASRRESEGVRSRVLRRPPALPDRLGAQWQQHADKQPGVRLGRIDHDGPADRAGLAIGDRVLKVGSWPIHEPGELEGAILTAPDPVELVVQDLGGEEPRTVTVHPRGPAWRLGFTWVIDEAEPETATVTHVVPGTPAARAGLQRGDLIQRLGGREFSTNDELMQAAREANDPIELLIEREGRLQTLVVPVHELPPLPGI